MSRSYKYNDDSLQIRWGDSAYYFDLIPKEYFDKECVNEKITHFMFWDKNDKTTYKVDCSLTVSNKQALLVYSEDQRHELDIHVGTLIIHFTDSSRNLVERVDWKGENGLTEGVAKSSWDLVDDIKEGQQYLREAKLLRRSADLVAQKKRAGNFTCAACGYCMRVGDTHIIDCHHTKLISEGLRVTNSKDLVLLCPNCHRIAHTETPPLSVEAIKAILINIKNNQRGQ